MKKLCGLFGLLTLLVAIGCQPAEEPAKKEKAGDGAAKGSNTTQVVPAAEIQLS